MNAIQMKYEFLTGVDAVVGLNNASYRDRQTSTFLTQAQEEYLFDRFSQETNNGRSTITETEMRGIGFSQLIKSSRDETTGVLTTSISANQNGVMPLGKFFDLPSDFFYFLHGRCKIKFTSNYRCNNSGDYINNVPVKTVTEDYYNGNIINPLKAPYEKSVWRLHYKHYTIDNNKKVRDELISASYFDIEEYEVRYLRRPKPIITGVLTNPIDGLAVITDCELDESTHREIVRRAIRIALAATKEQDKYQVSIMENQKQN
jgi:hypothetical protein